jgi:hypothetical protein
MKKMMLLSIYLVLSSLIYPVSSEESSTDLNIEIRNQRHRRGSAWAYSLSTGPTAGYSPIDIDSSSNEFIELEIQHPSSDIVFTDLADSNSGTMVTFRKAGTYFVQFSVAAESNPLAIIYPAPNYLIGVYRGKKGNVPNALPEGDLFLGLGDDVYGDTPLAGFLTVFADAGDTIALGNATRGMTGGTNLFLQQGTSVSSSGHSTNSTTAAINIIKLE